jgi:hypothetical protein
MKRVIIKNNQSSLFDIFLSGTGEDDNTGSENTSPSKKTTGKPGRKPTKNADKKDNDQEVENENGNMEKYFIINLPLNLLGTGDDDAENEGESPSKKSKGQPGRKAGQKNKRNNQEADNETGKN